MASVWPHIIFVMQGHMKMAHEDGVIIKGCLDKELSSHR